MSRNIARMFLFAFVFVSMWYGAGPANAVTLPVENIQMVYDLGEVDPQDGLGLLEEFAARGVPEDCQRLVVFTTNLDRGILRQTAQAMCRPDFLIPKESRVRVMVDMGRHAQEVPVRFEVFSIMPRVRGVFHEAEALDDTAWAERARNYALRLPLCTPTLYSR